MTEKITWCDYNCSKWTVMKEKKGLTKVQWAKKWKNSAPLWTINNPYLLNFFLHTTACLSMGPPAITKLRKKLKLKLIIFFSNFIPLWGNKSGGNQWSGGCSLLYWLLDDDGARRDVVRKCRKSLFFFFYYCVLFRWKQSGLKKERQVQKRD